MGGGCKKLNLTCGFACDFVLPGLVLVNSGAHLIQYNNGCIPFVVEMDHLLSILYGGVPWVQCLEWEGIMYPCVPQTKPLLRVKESNKRSYIPSLCLNHHNI